MFSFSAKLCLKLIKDKIMDNKKIRKEIEFYLFLYNNQNREQKDANKKMNKSIQSIIYDAVNGNMIDENDFSSIIDIIQNQNKFREKSYKDIYDYFEPIIMTKCE